MNEPRSATDLRRLFRKTALRAVRRLRDIAFLTTEDRQWLDRIMQDLRHGLAIVADDRRGTTGKLVLLALCLLLSGMEIP